MLVSQYGACSDTCLPWQGKVYIDDVFQEYHGPGGGSFGVSRNGHQYLFLSVAIKAGLFHPNCRHTVSTWFEGISTRPKPMNIREIERVNKLEARQRYLERRVREAKRQAAGLTDEAAQAEAQEELEKRQAELDDFLREHDDVLRRDRWRERDTGVPKDWETIGNNQFTNAKSDDTISVSRENGVKTDVNYVCKLNKELYQVVSPNVEADDVIITDQQIEHVNEGHPNNYERFNPYLPSVIADPDYILEGNKPNTALVLKSVEIEGQILEVVLRLRVTGDPEDYKNSIISMWGLSEKRFNRLLRRGKILYKKE